MTPPEKQKKLVKENYWSIFLIVFVGLLILVPAVWTGWEFWNHPSDSAQRKFNASLEFAKTIATTVGGLVLYLNFRVAQRKLDEDTKKAKVDSELAESRLITDRFSKAIEQLGSEKLAVRLGGIYALERIAYDSDRDHWTIMEVLTSFIQEKTSSQQIPDKDMHTLAQKLWEELGGHEGTEEQCLAEAILELKSLLMSKDIQAALTVIKRRQEKDPPGKILDLSRTNLIQANLSGNEIGLASLKVVNIIRANLGDSENRLANLRFANLSHANLSGANLNLSDLSCTNLSLSDLSGVDLGGANLSAANLISANLSNANLGGANLSGANLSGANLSGAIFDSANLSHAKVINANLKKATFNSANLSNARLFSCNAEDADFTEANLTSSDLDRAKLTSSNFHGADLFGAKLTNTDLSHASLYGANLYETDFNLAKLTNTDLRLATNLTTEQLDNAVLCQTQLPQEMSLDPNQNCGELAIPEG